MSADTTGAKKIKELKIPHTYALLFFMIVIMAALTWIVPSGTFQKIDKEVAPGLTKSVIVAGTYHEVPKINKDGVDSRQGIFEILTAPTKGIQDAAQVVAFVFILGGAFAIITKTGAIDAGLAATAKSLRGKEKLVIPVIMIIIGIGGSLIGTSEETIPFYMVFIPLMISFGYDSLTAILMIYLSSQIGYVGSTLNPFNVLVAQGIAGIHGNPQLWFRCIQWVVYITVAIAFVMIRASKIKKNPQASLSYADDLQNRDHFFSSKSGLEDIEFTSRHKIILLGFAAGIAWMVWGLLVKAYYMDEIAAVFFAIGVFAGIVGQLKINDMAEAFVFGCKDFVYAAIIIGIARSILIVAENGMIIDTLLNALANSLKGIPTAGFTTVMLFAQNIIAFFVPSSSGQAALTMPLMAPLGDLLKINKEAIVTTYQAANGITNIISPTSGVLMAALGIARISFSQWLKTVIKFVLVIELIAIVFCIISAMLPM